MKTETRQQRDKNTREAREDFSLSPSEGERVGVRGKVPDRIVETEPPLLEDTPLPDPLPFGRGEGICRRRVTPQAVDSV